MPMTPLFEIPSPPLVPVAGSDAGYPVRRIFCVGRNYAAHAAEMGAEVDREAPFYFTKSAHALVLSGATIPYPPGTEDLHHEVELVVALGEAGVLGYAVGLDLTRRDLQARAKEGRRPWDLGKDFENAAVLGPITRAEAFGAPGGRAIRLEMDGREVQAAHLLDMVWSVPEIVEHLGGYYTLGAGDLIYTGTPAGVGPIARGAHLRGRIDGLEPLELRVGA